MGIGRRSYRDRYSADTLRRIV